MSDPHADARWRSDFERWGEEQVRDTLNHGHGFTNEEQRQAAIRWLIEQSRTRKQREQRSYQYVRWTFYAAVAAVIVGIIGIVATLKH